MVCMRVAFHENEGNHENDENDDKDNLDATNSELSTGLAEITETEMTKTRRMQGAMHGFPTKQGV